MVEVRLDTGLAFVDTVTLQGDQIVPEENWLYVYNKGNITALLPRDAVLWAKITPVSG